MAIGDKKAVVMQSDIVNDFTTGGTANVLSAEMGKSLAQRPNPNLLDNWYFGNPIDQRGGYVVKPGVEYYQLDSMTVGGTTTAYYKVISIDSNGNPTFSIGGTKYWTWGSNMVHGYTGEGYTVDRWIKIGGTILMTDEGLSFLGNSGTNDYIFDIRQALDSGLLKSVIGRTVTLSTLIRIDAFSGNQLWLQLANDTKQHYSLSKYLFAATNGWVLLTHTIAIPIDWESTDYVRFTIGANGTNIAGAVKAVKLELGNHQTLAHQDSSGNWVLNEIPDYGEQLTKCQRYYYRMNADKTYSVFGTGAYYSGNCMFVIPFPTTMRTIPVFGYSGSFILVGGSSLIPVSNITYDGQNRENSTSCACITTHPEESISIAPYILQANNDTYAYLEWIAEL